MIISSKHSWSYLIIAASLASLMGITGCAKKPEQQATTQQETTTFNIGFQKYGILPIVKTKGELEKRLAAQGIKVKWIEFPAGPQLLEGLNVGSVVFGEAGEAPPIFAQAANSNLVYVANQPPAPAAEALIVQKDSPIQSIQDLKGKRIALNKGSNVHYLLLKLLEANQLTLNDIQPIYLPPADARAAFEKGAVDAWVIWDPFFAAAEHQIQARVIANGENLVNNHQFYLADRQYAENNPAVLQTVITTLNQTTDWVKAHPDDAAKLLEKPTGLGFDVLKTSISRMGFGVQPISEKVVTEQQDVANAFFAQQLIPKQLVIQDAVLKNNIR
ncbi:sulfonate ABC transporter substrate-binding protein [Acinetobacter haemolyticus]|uniref:sulfonate ABC transporter substrate-binding protein n=1 Tax=Acinetobacter haemolyticus TaxID=29430 RepID=UPI000C2C89A9|nr:sulfonate ABC transporter substrate-binding protein [Acinetobacter haemolyticus]ATZ68652.1 sulfonate ABC transporter substrate-binding protein [Acinetobacter haemolyticus]NAR19406.1 aliphatic sulfonate ABC transporter substrate-binding protein [Acinetobacter haemolyticus]NAR80375.1 aliphatic sulfonate ABC transporter substrate-binding protein [Acinetobacter haemolyticus]NAR86753.1 aliphatic sulfonate ABC transporter substrate-binding protein [Acinetobacter haemolyticus]NAR95346.1 aliphatic 